ncbi:MAG: hypothetical protein R3208_03990 [Ketobacteraceae bacterium]|nr:hypothetical protein [Ketobacteraceae bacterium]
MKTTSVKLISTLALAGFSVSALANDIRTALTNGDVDLNLRYRLEQVDEDGRDKDALASTLKTRLTYTSQSFNNTQLLLEFDDVHVVGEQRYLDGEDRPMIADPEGTELNQAALIYKGVTNTTITAGKQRIVLGNQRYVGGVAWRQHEQTYNAVSFLNESLSNTKLFYSYIDQVNSFIHTADDINHDSHLLYLENTSLDQHKITAYAFLLDNRDNHNQSSQTLGARFEGGVAGLGYALEYAQQSEYSRPDGNDLDADYEFLEVSYKIGDVKVLAALEVLGSDDGNAAFQTPLATKHKFNGWADKFLVTPNDGLEDTYVGAIATISGTTVKLFYHEFEANEGNNEYGEEIDLAVARKFGDFNCLLKLADYKADEDDATRTDTQKIWLQVATTF